MSTAPFLLGLSLAGRRVVAVGGGAVTARRVADLVAAGAHVHVVAPTLAPQLAALLPGAATRDGGGGDGGAASRSPLASVSDLAAPLAPVGADEARDSGAPQTGASGRVVGRLPFAENGSRDVDHGDAPVGRVSWEARPYAGEDDLAGAWLVHVATGDPAVDARVAADAERARVFCVAAGEASRGTARVPARAVIDTESGPISLAVHAADDPRRAVAVRGAVQDHLATCAATHLASGAVDLTSRRRPVPPHDPRPVRPASATHPTRREAVA